MPGRPGGRPRARRAPRWHSSARRPWYAGRGAGAGGDAFTQARGARSPESPYRGGVSVVRLLGIRDTPLSVDECLAAVADPAAGGIAIFVGTVRDEDGGRDVSALDYSAHPTAADELRQVVEKVAAD